ncbi:MAG: sulfite exporter TauE/SafE family protein [Sphingobacteriales bacterium]|nr:sulfite exporter TauE/SafE family protein [Sphingobacteriales bacterium]
MTILSFTLILLLGSFIAGLLGSLTGLGGGVIIIPMLTLIFQIDIRYAIGASLISVIATSSGAAAAYVREGISNIRIGMFLEIATTVGAVLGAILAAYTTTSYIAIVFGFILLLSAVVSFKHKEEIILNPANSGKLGKWLKLNGTYPNEKGKEIPYGVAKVISGFLMMMVAGLVSGLLGIGSGALKVIAMDNFMRLPFKVSTTTSNFMIGVTAAASAGVYLERGYIDPGLSMPVVIGVLVGAFVGSKLLVSSGTKFLRILFAAVIIFLAFQMIYNGFTGKI